MVSCRLFMRAGKYYWKIWLLVALVMSTFAAYWASSSPFVPNLKLLFHKPASRMETISASGDWATYAMTPMHQRLVEKTASLKGKIRWSWDQSQMASSSPAVKDGILYVGGDGRFVAINAATGNIIWTYPVIGPVSSSPAVAGDLVFLGLLDGRIIALNRHSGNLQWQYRTGNFVGCSPTVVNGLLYIGSSDGRLYAMDAKLGTPVWSVPINGDIVHAPAVGDDIVYTAAQSHKLYSLSARTGARRLEFMLPRGIIDAAVVTRDIVYVVTEDGRLTALKHKTRQKPWTHSVNAIWTQLWLMGVPVPRPPLQPGTLWRRVPEDRESRFLASPAVGNGRLYGGDNRGRFYALDAQTGKFLWQVELGSVITTAPLLIGDTVYFGTKAGVIHGAHIKDGSPRWKFHIGKPLKGDLVYAADLLFARTTDGTLHAIE